MKPKPPPTTDTAALRRYAEERLTEQRPEAGPSHAEADAQRLVHELQVHQIELELQNEELQQARDEVEAEREKFSDLYDFAPVGYVTLDCAGSICEANLAGAAVLGSERSRLVQRRFRLFVSATHRSEFNDFLAKVFATRAREACELTLQLEGKPPVEVRLEAAATASGQACRVVLLDITDRKQAEADRLLRGKLESAVLLAVGMAEDYSRLLTVTLLNLELARELVPPTEDFLAQRLATAEKAALQAQELTRQLGGLARPGVPPRTVTAPAGVLQAAVQTALSGSPVRCDCSLAGNLWPVAMDAWQVGQCFRNLLVNAREAMPRKGVVSIRAANQALDARTDLPLPPGDYVRVTISDQGGGVAQAVLPKIFDPYFTTKPPTTHPGTGLGLTVCQAVVQQHGGAIRVQSELGAGTTFDLYLPAAHRGASA